MYEGGTGNDVLRGTYYGDTYRFNTGDGQDVIQDYGYTGFTDRIVLGEGITASDVHATHSGESLVLHIGTNGDQITIADWYHGPSYEVERLEFADGTVWTASTLSLAGLEQHGTAGDDTLTALAGFNDRLYGEAGNDTLIGGAGMDTLMGGCGRRCA